jgi:hypothetical protein
VLSSEEAQFGGLGALFPSGEGPWNVAGACAFVLASVPDDGESPER